MSHSMSISSLIVWSLFPVPIFINVFIDLFPNSINLDVGMMISRDDFTMAGLDITN
jgi:hypothetical protein